MKTTGTDIILILNSWRSKWPGSEVEGLTQQPAPHVLLVYAQILCFQVPVQ
jgi:hypothetical protein